MLKSIPSSIFFLFIIFAICFTGIFDVNGLQNLVFIPNPTTPLQTETTYTNEYDHGIISAYENEPFIFSFSVEKEIQYFEVKLLKNPTGSNNPIKIILPAGKALIDTFSPNLALKQHIGGGIVHHNRKFYYFYTVDKQLHFRGILNESDEDKRNGLLPKVSMYGEGTQISVHNKCANTPLKIELEKEIAKIESEHLGGSAKENMEFYAISSYLSLGTKKTATETIFTNKIDKDNLIETQMFEFDPEKGIQYFELELRMKAEEIDSPFDVIIKGEKFDKEYLAAYNIAVEDHIGWGIYHFKEKFYLFSTSKNKITIRNDVFDESGVKENKDGLLPRVKLYGKGTQISIPKICVLKPSKDDLEQQIAEFNYYRMLQQQRQQKHSKGASSSGGGNDEHHQG